MMPSGAASALQSAVEAASLGATTTNTPARWLLSAPARAGTPRIDRRHQPVYGDGLPSPHRVLPVIGVPSVKLRHSKAPAAAKKERNAKSDICF